ncbi:hypothetical protein [Pseudomonas aeruginosa]|uniref:hypothetical protein n=1 Tax=Pseudomonas aeruginosa TaxID=287 RepID=UPI003D7F1E35
MYDYCHQGPTQHGGIRRVITRWLRRGYDLTYVRNITDDDTRSSIAPTRTASRSMC